MREDIDMPRTVIPSGFNLVSGTYIGNGADNRQIDCGFRPELVIVKGNTTQYGVFRTTEMPDNEAGYLYNTAANLADSIQTFNSKGFVVGTDGTVNNAGVVYHWIAIAKGDGSDFATFTYTGNETARDITGLGFQPEAVFIKENGTSTMTFRTKDHTTTNSSLFFETANQTDAITALISDGFSLGTSTITNENSTTYYGFAFRNSGNGVFDTDTYVGNGSDDHAIDTPGFRPALLFVRAQTSSGSVGIRSKFATFSGTDSTDFKNVIFFGTIKSFSSTGFVLPVSASANANGSTYIYVALKANRTRVLAE